MQLNIEAMEKINSLYYALIFTIIFRYILNQTYFLILGVKKPWVQVPPLGPRRRKLCIACDDFFMRCMKKSTRAHTAAPPLQIEPASLGFDLVNRDR